MLNRRDVPAPFIGWLVLVLLVVLRPAPAAAQESPPAAPPPPVVQHAQALLGTPYVWAGDSPSVGFDCSGLVQYVYAQVGVSLPHNAAAQDDPAAGTRIARTDLAPGDLVFFAFTGSIDHVGIYVGDGWMIHAHGATGVVEYAPLWDAAWWSYAVGGLRVGGQGSGVGGEAMENAEWRMEEPTQANAAHSAFSTLHSPLEGPIPETGPTDPFQFVQAPTIDAATYAAILVAAGSPAAPEAHAMYQVLVAAGLDPAIELAFARKETSYGTTGIGASQRNLHGITCNAWDHAYGATCDGRFSTYPTSTDSVRAWAALILGYAQAGLTTPRQALPTYAPAFENDTARYIQQVEQWVSEWRGSGVWGRGTGVGQPTPPPSIPPAAAHEHAPAPDPRPQTPDTEPAAPVEQCSIGHVTDDHLRLRTAPGLAGEIVTTVAAGTEVQVLCRDRIAQVEMVDGLHWVQVQHAETPLYVWVALDYLATPEKEI